MAATTSPAGRLLSFWSWKGPLIVPVSRCQSSLAGLNVGEAAQSMATVGRERRTSSRATLTQAQEAAARQTETYLAHLGAQKKAPANALPEDNPLDYFAAFLPGEYLAPHKLTPSAVENFKRSKTMRKRLPLLGPSQTVLPRTDPFMALGFDPLDETFNPGLFRWAMTQTGMIRARRETGLSIRNQRRMSKAIRRARSMGILPYFSMEPIWGTGDSDRSLTGF